MSQELKLKIFTDFTNRFQKRPLMFFSPGRINIIGEHTDYNHGLVLPAAIHLGITIALSESDQEHCTIFAKDLDQELKLNLNDLIPEPGSGWQNYVKGICHFIAAKGKILRPFNLLFSGNLPIGAGLSSSAALTNGIGYGLNKLFNFGLSRQELADISLKTEHKFAGLNCGIMDQYANLFGKQDQAILLDCNTQKFEIIPARIEGFNWLLVDSRVKHDLAQTAYNDRRESCLKVSRSLGKRSLREVSIPELLELRNNIPEKDFSKALFVLKENERVKMMVLALKNKDAEKAGKLLLQSHYGLKDDYEVSCDELDFLVEQALSISTVKGSRMMGGGFGGCTLNLIEQESENQFRVHISKRYREKFNRECQFYDIELSNGTCQTHNIS